jgi:hypothetical protein
VVKRSLLAVAALAAALALPVAAPASRADDEVRVRGSCTPGRASELRVRSDDGELRVELRVDSRRRGEAWTVLLLHERRIAVRTKATTKSGGSLRVRRSLPDLFGTDTVVARASGPGAATCRASARL